MSTYFHRRIAVLILLVAALMLIPIWTSKHSYVIQIVMLFGLYLSLGQMWNLLAGYSGLISLGQQIFIGMGGYTFGVLMMKYGWHVWLSILAGGVVSALFALVISIPIFRMSGVYFSIGTWIVAEALRLWFEKWKYTGEAQRFIIDPILSDKQLYYAAVSMGIVSVAVVFLLLRSRLGLSLMAMRDDEGASEGVGVDRFRSKLICFLVASFITGITAGILFLNQGGIYPGTAFGINWTVYMCFIVIIGGIGTIEGPIVGALIYVTLQQYFAEYASISLILLGGVSVLTMLVMPKGIMGTIQEKLGFELLSPRRS
jgi:branched-chain amino acid transport system permease protein